jgi:hypothetical protein
MNDLNNAAKTSRRRISEFEDNEKMDDFSSISPFSLTYIFSLSGLNFFKPPPLLHLLFACVYSYNQEYNNIKKSAWVKIPIILNVCEKRGYN